MISNALGFFILIPSLVYAHEWQGKGGMLCVDTPIPTKYSKMEYKEALSGGPIDDSKSREERLAELEKRPFRYDGELVIRVDDGPPVDLPKGKGVFIDGLDPLKKHKIEIGNKAGKGFAAFSFNFDDPKDPRAKLAQSHLYHDNMQFNSPPKRGRWAN